MSREESKLETINGRRSYNKRLMMSDTVEGSLEMDVNVADDATVYIIKQAMGGTCTALTVTAGSVLHTLHAGDMDNNSGTTTSTNTVALSVAVRRGLVNTWNHYGGRVNNLTLSGEIGSPVKMTAEMVFKGASVGSTIPSIGLSAVLPINFVGVQVYTGATISAVTAETFKSFELTINNNINTDHRKLGSREVVTLKPQRREVMLSLTQSFDTTTAYDRFIQNTMTAIQLTMDSEQTITAGGTTYAMIVRLPACYANSNQPEVGGPELIEQELEFSCIYGTVAGYDIEIDIRNATANYF